MDEPSTDQLTGGNGPTDTLCLPLPRHTGSDCPSRSRRCPSDRVQLATWVVCSCSTAGCLTGRSVCGCEGGGLLDHHGHRWIPFTDRDQFHAMWAISVAQGILVSAARASSTSTGPARSAGSLVAAVLLSFPREGTSPVPAQPGRQRGPLAGAPGVPFLPSPFAIRSSARRQPRLQRCRTLSTDRRRAVAAFRLGRAGSMRGVDRYLQVVQGAALTITDA